MAHVINSVFISSRCHKTLESFSKQVESLKRYFLEYSVLELFINALNKKNLVLQGYIVVSPNEENIQLKQVFQEKKGGML